MAFKEWFTLKNLGDKGFDFFSDLFAGFTGAKVAEVTSRRSAAAMALGAKIAEVVAPADLEDVMKALIYHLGDGGSNAILNLLIEAKEKHYILEGGIKYRENWIADMLLNIEEPDRQWVFLLLNRECKRDRKRFFGLLEVMENNKYKELLRILKDTAKDYVDVPAINARLSQATTRIHNSPWRQRLHERANRPGAFRRLRARLRR